MEYAAGLAMMCTSAPISASRPGSPEGPKTSVVDVAVGIDPMSNATIPWGKEMTQISSIYVWIVICFAATTATATTPGGSPALAGSRAKRVIGASNGEARQE